MPLATTDPNRSPVDTPSSGGALMDGAPPPVAAQPAPITIARCTGPAGGHVLETELWVPRPPHDVFPYFADAANLEALTPPWLNFQILTPLPIDMRPGTLIDYRIRLRGLPIRWRTEISVWEPGVRFVDQQVRGPYRLWIHEHTFVPHAGGTLVRDRVHYRVPGGRVVHWLFVQAELLRIFAFRRMQMQRQWFEA